MVDEMLHSNVDSAGGSIIYLFIFGLTSIFVVFIIVYKLYERAGGQKDKESSTFVLDDVPLSD